MPKEYCYKKAMASAYTIRMDIIKSLKNLNFKVEYIQSVGAIKIISPNSLDNANIHLIYLATNIHKNEPYLFTIDTTYTVRNDGKNFVNSSSLYWSFPQLDISEISILKDVIYFCVELVKSQVRRHKELT